MLFRSIGTQTSVAKDSLPGISALVAQKASCRACHSFCRSSSLVAMHPMLRLGVTKVQGAGQDDRVTLVRGDAMRLPVAANVADAVTVAFGIRNVEQPEVACREMARALRPGGRLAILEFGTPRVPGLRSLYQWYFRSVLPLLGRMISGHNAAYSYLPASVGAFPPPDVFCETLRRAGFNNVRAVPLTFGIVYLYMGRRAAP